jgi:hypothetical protein
MSKKKKLCPFRVNTERANNVTVAHFDECYEHRCALWTEVFTAEYGRVSGCALMIRTHMNQNGMYVV